MDSPLGSRSLTLLCFLVVFSLHQFLSHLSSARPSCLHMHCLHCRLFICLLTCNKMKIHISSLSLYFVPFLLNLFGSLILLFLVNIWSLFYVLHTWCWDVSKTYNSCTHLYTEKGRIHSILVGGIASPSRYICIILHTILRTNITYTNTLW